MAFVMGLLVLWSCQQKSKPISFSIEEQQSGTDALLIGVSILSEESIWMSGTKSTVIRTLDGGNTWDRFKHPEIDTFQFRDIHAFDDGNVIVLASGEGDNSQIHLFSPDDGWKTVFVMDNKKGFLNSIAFWNDREGLAYGDAFDESPYLLKTSDGGKSWERIDASSLPEANEGEGGFASSGSCIDVGEGGKAWVGTGAGGSARVIKTSDYGESWEAYESPMVRGEFAGITSIHFRNDQNGMIAGGDLTDTEGYTENIAFSQDAGETWDLASTPNTVGAFYGSDFIKIGNREIALVCGPNGADLSLDGGNTWNTILEDNLWVTDLHPSGLGWVAGRDGKIFKIVFNQ